MKKTRDVATHVDDPPDEQHVSLSEQLATRPKANAGAHAHRGNPGSWAAVSTIILGFALGAFALPTHWLILWILAGVALVVGGALALSSRIMDQAH